VVLLRHAISNPRPSLLLHARLPLYKPRGIELLQHVVLNPEDDIQASGAGTGLHSGVLYIEHIYELLDYAYILALGAAL